MQIAHQRYTTVAIWLHWAIAILIIANVIIGLDFGEPLPGERFARKPLLWLHVSIGFTVLILSLARLAWRHLHPAPPHPDTMPAWEKRSAEITHALFYFLMIAMPMTGWLMISAHKVFPVKTIVWGFIEWPMLPVFGPLTVQEVAVWHHRFLVMHEITSVYLVIGMLALHVGAVAKHHLFDRDPVLRRMWPFGNSSAK